jgi:hypothetical protein
VNPVTKSRPREPDDFTALHPLRIEIAGISVYIAAIAFFVGRVADAKL